MGKPRVWVVNDYLTTIPGSRTLWHDLCDWFDAPFIGGDYSTLARKVHSVYKTTPHKPDVVIRNGSYVGPFDIPCPQIALFQDILLGHGKEMQREVMKRAVPVFNSEWTKAQFGEAGKDGWVIPLPIDFGLFKPLPDREGLRKKWGILPNSVCWIGAASNVKGADILIELVNSADFNWCIVIKDVEWSLIRRRPNVRMFSRVPQSDLVEIINACSVGLCTSRVETQHLAGLEMGACGLPLVTTNVGAYYRRSMGSWGEVSQDSRFLGLKYYIRAVDNELPQEHVRSYWLKEGFDRQSCEKAWRECVKEVVDA